MFGLFANGAPPYPMPDAPALEWAVWGACIGTACLLGGWGIWNHNRPERDTRVGVSLLVAMVLVAFGSLWVMQRTWVREQARINQSLKERAEQMKREHEERSQP